MKLILNIPDGLINEIDKCVEKNFYGTRSELARRALVDYLRSERNV